MGCTKPLCHPVAKRLTAKIHSNDVLVRRRTDLCRRKQAASGFARNRDGQRHHGKRTRGEGLGIRNSGGKCSRFFGCDSLFCVISSSFLGFRPALPGDLQSPIDRYSVRSEGPGQRRATPSVSQNDRVHREMATSQLSRRPTCWAQQSSVVKTVGLVNSRDSTTPGWVERLRFA